MKSRDLLVLIAVILVAILGVVAYESFQPTPAEQVADDVGDVSEQIEDQIRTE